MRSSASGSRTRPRSIPSGSSRCAELDARLRRRCGCSLGPRDPACCARRRARADRHVRTETIARLLGLRVNHPIGSESLERAPNEPASRAEAAYSLAKLRLLDTARIAAVRDTAATFVVSELGTWERQVVVRALRFVGFPYVFSGTSEKVQRLWSATAPGGTITVPGGSDCSGLVWRSSSPPVRRRAAARRSAQGAHDVRDERGGRPDFRIAPTALRPGDVLFFGDRGPKSKPSEVGHSASTRERLVRPLLERGRDATAPPGVVRHAARLGAASAGRSRPVRPEGWSGVRAGGSGTSPCGGRGCRARGHRGPPRPGGGGLGGGRPPIPMGKGEGGPGWSSWSSSRSSSAGTSSAATGSRFFARRNRHQRPSRKQGAGSRGAPRTTLFEFTNSSAQARRTSGRRSSRTPTVRTGGRPFDLHRGDARPAAGPGLVRDGAVLLPGGQQGLPRPLVRAAALAAVRRLRRPRLGLVVAHEIGHHVQTALGIEANVRRQQQKIPGTPSSTSSAWSCRPTASPASGRTRRTRGETSRRATSRKPSAPPRPSATTGSARRAASSGRTAPRRSVRSGSAAASSPATRTTATPATSI